MNKEQEKKLLNNTSINKAGRPKGSLNKRTVIRQALAQTFENGEAGFWLAVAEQAKAGDAPSMKLLADRLAPPLKAQGETVVLSKPLDGNLADNARAILQLVAVGEISADVAKELLSALADVGKILEITELEKRLQKLEELHSQKG